MAFWNLIARMTMDSTAFDRNATRARRSLRDIGEESLRVQRHLMAFARAGLAAAGVGGLGLMFKRQMDLVDQTAKLSDRLRISTESLTAWGHGAALAGGSAELLDNSLEQFVKNLGEASLGIGRAKVGFDALGASARSLMDLGPERAFVQTVEMLSHVPDVAQRAAVARQIFGDTAKGLLNMFAQGKGGLAAMRDEADRLGITFTRLDANRVEQANNAMTRMRAAVEGMTRQIAIDMSPYIEGIARNFTEGLAGGRRFGDEMLATFEALTIGAIRFRETLGGIGGLLRQLSPTDAAMETRITERSWAEYRRRMAVRGTPDEEAFRNRRFGFGVTPPRDSQLHEQIRAEMREAENTAARSMQSEAVTSAEKWFADLRVQAQRRRWAADATFMAERWLQPDPDWSGGQLGGATEAPKPQGIDLAAAYRRMFGDLDSRSKESFELRAGFIEEERNLIRDAIAEHLKGREDELNRGLAMMEKWHAERLRLLEIDKAKAGDDLFAGWRAGISEMQREMETLGQLGANFAKTLRDGLAEGFTDAIMNARSLQDVMRGLMQEMLRMTIQWSMKQMFTTVLGSFGGSVAHGGGVFGEDTFPRRVVPAAAFAGADRLHGGIGPGERPAIIRDDEGVFTAGQMRALGRGMRGAASGGDAQRLEHLMGRAVGLLERTLLVQERIAARDDLVVVERQELGAQVQRDRRRRGGLSQVLRGRD